MKKLICSACVMIMMSSTPFEVCASEKNPTAEAEVQRLTAQLSDANVRCEAVRELCKIGEANPSLAKVIVETLTAQLSDTKKYLHETANALSLVGRKNPNLAQGIVETLIPLCDDHDICVVYALGKIGEANPNLAQRIVDTLIPMLNDPNDSVRHIAVVGLSVIGKANSNLAQRIVDALSPLLKGKDARNRAVKVIEEIRKANPALNANPAK